MDQQRSVSTLILFSGLLTALPGCHVNSGNVVVNGRVINGSGNGVFISGANGSAAFRTQQVTAEFRQTLPAGGIQTLDVRGENGNISVVAASEDASRIVVHAIRQVQGNRPLAQLRTLLPELKVIATVEGAKLVLKSEYPRAWDNQGISASVNYEVAVPARLVVDITDVSGSVKYAGAAAALKLATTNGNVNATLNGSPTNAHVSSVNGSLDLRLPPDTSAHLTADTINGRVDIPHAKTNEERTSAQATLGSGRVPIVLTTTNGNIRVEAP